MPIIPTHGLVDRFIKYVKIDTQSDPESPTCPSTEKQFNLARVLVDELKELGLTEIELDENGYVYASLEGNVDWEVPVICFCSHMDTSPDMSGENVSPIIHENYQGGDLTLPKENVVLKAAQHPDLQAQIGNDIITADGTTLLGADNKAGLAEIMAAMQYLKANPEVKHGKIRVLFTPDEEIGRGADKVNMKLLNADYGYTVDGETLGSMEDETFSADGATVVIKGLNIHPGFAKGRMVNALKVAADYINNLPNDNLAPEFTDGREPFVHPYEMSGSVDEVKIQFILRSFVTAELEGLADLLREALKKTLDSNPGAQGEVKVQQQYRNMKEVLDKYPLVSQIAQDAIVKAGIALKKRSIRGGTDGSKLSYMGLPCPNIFAGEHAFHSREEWVSVQDMQKSSEVIVNIAQLWTEYGAK